MTYFLKRIWTAAPVATIILGVAVVAVLLFGGRMVSLYIYWNDPAHQEQDIKGWMTPNYISRSWQVPPDVIFDALDAPRPPPDGPMNIEALAAYRGVTVDELATAAQEAIADFRAEHPVRMQP